MFFQNVPISQIMFNKYDTDHSGHITIEEFRSMSYDLGYYLSDTELDLAVKTLDKTGSGKINYNDFQSWWKSSDRWNKVKLTDENMTLLSALSGQFQLFDKNKSGSINKDEFKNFWTEVTKSKKVSEVEEREIFEQLDSNKDKQITFVYTTKTFIISL